MYNLYHNDIRLFDEIVESTSCNWEQYRVKVVKWRVEYDAHEYVAMLLLGIAEEYQLFDKAKRLSPKNKDPKLVLEKFGAFLFNVAELNNVLDEEFARKKKSTKGKWATSPMAGVEVVRKYCTVRENVDKKKMIEYAVLIAGGMVAAYTTMITAQDAMIVNLRKMEERHG
jgi:hypothetical protein